ncbi:MAG: hypothetical protein M3Y59_18470 [Myxococcota bacterium]|nr:hypothetical protein [Myxococcota bacterium]
MSHTPGAGWLRSGLLVVLFLTACAPAGPRFPSNVMATFRRDEMHHLKTANVELYYPAEQRELALRVLGRLDTCVEKLRSLPRVQRQREPVLAYLTSANFNNAYAYYSIAGSPRQLLLPTHLSLELFEWFNLGLGEVGDVSCHEALHYVQMEQVEGGWALVNWLLGDVFSPNAMIEPWFSEGLATYYEARMDRRVGRPHSPIWTGVLEAGLASQGGFRGSDLNALNRHMYPWGAHYLTGSWFVEWLVEKYGEQKLWELIDTQAHSIFSPLWVSLRFKAVYGTTLDGLITEANQDLQAKLQKRDRPSNQQVLQQDLGYFARITALEGGAIAAITSKLDEPDRLTVWEADGRVRFSSSVTQFKPGRDFISASSVAITGLSYSRILATGAVSPSLYLVVDDVDSEGNSDSKLVRFDAQTGEYRQHWRGFIGVGGDVRDDGKAYVLVEIENGISNLVSLDLATGQRTRLTNYGVGESLAAPRWSPDGKRVVFVRRGGESFDLAIREEDGQIRPLTQDAVFDFFPSWIDDRRIAFSRTVEDRAQVQVIDVDSGTLTQVSQAPYLAADPVAVGDDQIAFLNRQGWGWTLDVVPAAGQGAPLAQTEVPPLPDEPFGKSEAGPKILSDEPYQPLDGLFSPQLRGLIVSPWLHNGVGDKPQLGLFAGLMIKGSDRLGFHNYSLNISYESGLSAPDLELIYGNFQLAPWYLEVDAFRVLAGARQTVLGTTITEFAEVVDTGIQFSASRSFWTIPLIFNLHAFRREAQPFRGDPGYDVRFIGPQVGTGFSASEGSPYAGQRLGYSVSAEAAGYSDQVGSSATMADLRLTTSAALPLPLLKLHSLRLTARARSLPGAPDGLLRVGGIPLAIGLVTQGASQTPAPQGYALPGRIGFSEYLRGYEDYTFTTTSALMLGARYRLPLIIDRGWPSTFYLFPSFFLRQVELEGFWDSAVTAEGHWHKAAGGAVWLRTAFGSAVPFSLVYQFAYRFNDGLGPFHQIAVALE